MTRPRVARAETVAASPNPTITPPRRAPRKRGNPEQDQICELKESNKVLAAQLRIALKQNEKVEDQLARMSARVAVNSDQENKLLKEKVSRLQQEVGQLESRKLRLSYKDLYPGGALAGSVKEFTFFPDVECNDAFLALINFSDECDPGDGICENLVRYHHVSVADRRRHQERESVDAAMALLDLSTGPEAPGRPRAMCWKTEWLVYNFYVRCDISMQRIATLFGVSRTTVHDVVYAWANVLCVTLPKFFPAPTRSQLLRAYPKSVIKKFGRANIYMLLDATEIGAEVASMKTVNAVLYSAYKHGSTLKWLAACDPIGAVADPMVSNGHGGSISDPIQTQVSDILAIVPHGMSVEVDKGFLIENECALRGIGCVRPMKMMNGQAQQSAEDAALTQKVGKTRIVIEQVNGQAKQSTPFFDSKIKLQQLGLADLIFRSTYLMQNFKLPFIQERPDSAPMTRRPCKAEVRWHGATDEGLVDVRPIVELWGLDSEVKRWHELRSAHEHADLTDTDISEMVLAEDWPSKLRQTHNTAIDNANF